MKKILYVALVALASFVLFASCSPSFAGATAPPKTGSDPVESPDLNLGFHAISFDDAGKFRWLEGVDGEFGGKYTISLKDANDRPDFYLNGKKVAEQEVDQWQRVTVDARVKLYPDRFEFYGGKPAYNAVMVQQATAPPKNVIPPQGGCPNGQCPVPQWLSPRRR